MPRNIRDALLKTTKALPAQNANNNHDAIDLGAASPGASVERVEVLLTVPDLDDLADGQTATFTFQDSADGASFAAIPELETKVFTGAGGAGAAGGTRRVRLPSSVRRYIRVNQAMSATAGDNTAVETTVELLA